MTLYTKNGEYPKQIPHMIHLSDGKIRSDRTTFTEQEILDAGYVQVENPPNTEYPNKLEWDGENVQWVVRLPNDSEIMARWQEIKSECVRRLEETDYKVIKAFETGNPINSDYVTYRQELRDLYNNVNNIDPWTVVFPSVYKSEVGANTAI